MHFQSAQTHRARAVHPAVGAAYRQVAAKYSLYLFTIAAAQVLLAPSKMAIAAKQTTRRACLIATHLPWPQANRLHFSTIPSIRPCRLKFSMSKAIPWARLAELTPACPPKAPCFPSLLASIPLRCLLSILPRAASILSRWLPVTPSQPL